MSGLLFLAVFPIATAWGWAITAFVVPREFSLPERFVLSTVSGLAVLPLTLFFLSIVGVPWSVTLILLGGAASLALGFAGASHHRGGSAAAFRVPRPALAMVGLTLLVLTYAAATSRATSADLLLFWGAKGERFAMARGIDSAFLARPDLLLMHPDYPPLLPTLYAVGNLAAGRFSWFGSLLFLPVCSALSVAGFWIWARRGIGDRAAAESAVLLTGLLAYTLSVTLSAGNAEPVLLLFECASLGALCFSERPCSEWIASLALTGAVLTKFEGTPFAGLVILAFAFAKKERRWGKTARLALLPSIALGTWILYCRAHGLLDAYGHRRHDPWTLRYFGVALRELFQTAAYRAAYLPWIALVFLVLIRPRKREGLAPLLVGAGFAAVILLIYLHGTKSPVFWISWSGGRALLTPLSALFFASTAGTEPHEPAT